MKSMSTSLLLSLFLTTTMTIRCASSFAFSTKLTSRYINPIKMANDDYFEKGAAGELTSTLAVLDKQWQLKHQQGKSDWIQYSLEDSSSSTLPANEDYVYLLKPPNGSTTPSSVILFLGGAALGQFPHIAYSELLKKIALRLNAAVITAPYQVGLDHFDLAKQCGRKLRLALSKCEDEFGWSPSCPKIGLAHSLGTKLYLIDMAATNSADELYKIGFMSFNNYGLVNSIDMAKSFVKEIQENTGMGGGFGAGQDVMFDTLIDIATQAANAVGVEFSPSPEKMEQLIQLKFDKQLQSKTRLFCFDDDNLDSSRNLLQVIDEDQRWIGDGVTVSGLEGTHLTPVYLKLGLDNLPEDAKDVAGLFTDFRSASFGNEDHLNSLVTEICDWIYGKDPSKSPDWYEGSSGRKRLAGGVIDAEVEK